MTHQKKSKPSRQTTQNKSETSGTAISKDQQRGAMLLSLFMLAGLIVCVIYFAGRSPGAVIAPAPTAAKPVPVMPVMIMAAVVF